MKRQTQQSTIIDDFWTHDIPLFEGTFRYYRQKPQPVRGKVHVSNEQYDESYSEIVPIAPRKGSRTYVMMHPYVFEPILTFTVGLYDKPKQYADMGEAVGETVGGPKQEGVREVEIGNTQAWYYPADKTIILWECYLWSFVRDHPLTQDPQMKQLWQEFEKWLIKQFPQATRIATPFDDPLFEQEEYQAFLRTLGYKPVAKAAFGKPIK